jgi:hypothetical protein
MGGKTNVTRIQAADVVGVLQETAALVWDSFVLDSIGGANSIRSGFIHPHQQIVTDESHAAPSLSLIQRKRG